MWAWEHVRMLGVWKSLSTGMSYRYDRDSGDPPICHREPAGHVVDAKGSDWLMSTVQGQGRALRKGWSWSLLTITSFLAFSFPTPEGWQRGWGILCFRAWFPQSLAVWKWMQLHWLTDPLKSVGMKKSHRAMFLPHKQVLKNLSPGHSSFHNTFLIRPSGALQNMLTNSQGFVWLGREEHDNLQGDVLFCLKLYNPCHFL